jgi:hypothetical protein
MLWESASRYWLTHDWKDIHNYAMKNSAALHLILLTRLVLPISEYSRFNCFFPTAVAKRTLNFYFSKTGHSFVIKISYNCLLSCHSAWSTRMYPGINVEFHAFLTLIIDRTLSPALCSDRFTLGFITTGTHWQENRYHSTSAVISLGSAQT